VYKRQYLIKKDAESREKYLKTSMGQRVIKKQLKYLIEFLSNPLDQTNTI
jgi:hypothetical protein